jgi:hypothetical protein
MRLTRRGAAARAGSPPPPLGWVWLDLKRSPRRLNAGKPAKRGQEVMLSRSPQANLKVIGADMLRTKELGKGLRVLRLGEAEHHEIPVIAAQGVT